MFRELINNYTFYIKYIFKSKVINNYIFNLIEIYITY